MARRCPRPIDRARASSAGVPVVKTWRCASSRGKDRTTADNAMNRGSSLFTSHTALSTLRACFPAVCRSRAGHLWISRIDSTAARQRRESSSANERPRSKCFGVAAGDAPAPGLEPSTPTANASPKARKRVIANHLRWESGKSHRVCSTLVKTFSSSRQKDAWRRTCEALVKSSTRIGDVTAPVAQPWAHWRCTSGSQRARGLHLRSAARNPPRAAAAHRLRHRRSHGRRIGL